MSGSEDDDFDMNDIEVNLELIHKTIDHNPYDYNAHLQLISASRQRGDLDETRTSRIRFKSLLLPSTSDYLNWIEDELEIASSNSQDKQNIKNLFDLALKDHPASIDIWLEHLKFCESNYELLSIDLNSEYKKAGAFAAWDLKRGHLVSKQVNRAIPYISQSENSSPYESFEASFPHNLIQYIETVKLSKSLSSSDKLTLCRVLFERAIEINSELKIWEDYLKFLRSEMNVSTIILGVNYRLVRAHPLNFSSWILLIENLELFNKFDEIESVWNNSLPKLLLNSSHETFLALQMAHLDCLRRQNKKDEIFLAFQTIIQEEEILFGGRRNEAVDPQGRLPRYFGQVLHFYGEIERFRNVWQHILKQHAKEAAFWLEYLQLERSLMHRGGSLETVTNAFKRAAASVSDYPETIFHEWIQFEKQHGTSLQSLLDARERIEKQRAILKEREQQRQQKDSTQTSRKRNRVEQPEEPKTEPEVVEIKVKSFNPDATLFVNNLPFNFTESDIETHFNNLISKLGSQSSSVKSIRMHMNSSGKSFKGHATIEFDSPEICSLLLEKCNRQPADESGRPVFLAKYVSPLEQNKKSINKSESDAKTLYVSNLPFKESARVEELFKSLPGIQQIRHVGGKQFAYIEFESDPLAADALKLIPEIDKTIKAAFSKPPAAKTPIPNPNNPVSTTFLKPRSVSVKKP